MTNTAANGPAEPGLPQPSSGASTDAAGGGSSQQSLAAAAKLAIARETRQAADEIARQALAAEDPSYRKKLRQHERATSATGAHDAPEQPRGKRSIAGPRIRARQLWHKRGVLGLLVRRDLKVRYSDSVLGYLWSILDPLLMALIYWFVFTAIFRRAVGAEPYILYLLAGMLPFMWFQSAMNAAPRAIKGERLVRSVALPREIWVLRRVLAKGAEYILALPVLAIFALVYGKSVSWQIVFTPLAMLLQLILLTGLALFAAALGSLVRDVDLVMRILMRFLFYATPVLYGMKDVLDQPVIPEWLKQLYGLNPLTGMMSLYRSGFFPEQLDLTLVASSAVVSVAAFVGGWWVFARMESSVLKEI